LRTIGRAALARCKAISGIAIPASVEVIEQAVFKGCSGPEYCSMDVGAVLTRIGEEAFAECNALRSFEMQGKVEEIGKNCFKKCAALNRLVFRSAEGMKKIVGDLTLDAGMARLGFDVIASIFRVEVDHGGVELEFPGWDSGAGGSRLILVRHLS
jgi:hypothetical protein